MHEYLGKSVKVIIDRPLGSRHPKYEYIYPINYGYLPETKSGDDEEIDAYIIGENKPLAEFTGYVIAIIKRLDDVEDKLVVSCELGKYSQEDIKELTKFQEHYFKIEIVMLKEIG